MESFIAESLALLYLALISAARMAEENVTLCYTGKSASMTAAVTVDDLYEPISLRNILDVCLEYDVHITFFTLGIVIHPENAALWQRIVDEEHEIDNPAFGRFDHRGYGSVSNLGARGYPYLIMWSLGLTDLQRTFKCIHGGSILLLHTNWQDVNLLRELIPWLSDHGYEMATVNELLSLPPAERDVPDE